VRKSGRMAVLAGLVVAAAVAAPAQAQVITGQSGWEWGNPQPQGNQINDIGFSGGTGFAVGNFGTVIETPDGGQTWTGVVTGITADINKVSLPAPGTLIIGGGCYDLISADAGASFTQMSFTQPGPDCAPTVTSQSFVSPTTGFVLANTGQVFPTTDAGATFSGNAAPVPGTAAAGGGATATDIAFTSATTGFAIAGGTIFKTTNGAGSWTTVFSGGAVLNSVFFVDANHGYAVGAGSTVLKTTDGGTTWTSKPGATGQAGGAVTLTRIRCATDNLCLMVAEQSTGLVRTDDGGDKYSFVSFGSAPINAAAFASNNLAVAGGAGGAMFRSTDAGQTWAAVGSSLSRGFTGIRALNGSFAYAFGPLGGLATTSNGGVSWTPISIPSSNNVATASFLDPSNGYALDSGGTLWGTTNGGSTWARKNTGGGADPNDVAAVSTNLVLLIGPRGVRRSTNAGADFSTVSGRPVSTARLDSADVVGSAVFAYGSRAILVSGNGGRTWRSLDLPPTGSRNLRLTSAHCTSSRVCWALTANDHLYRTTNGGSRWTDVTPATGDNDLSSGLMSFDGSSSGFVEIPGFEPVSDNLASVAGGSGQGWVLATNDGGNSWAPQLLGASELSGVAAAGGTDYALGDGTSLFFTNTNGTQGQSSSLTISPSTKTIRRTTTVSLTVTLSPFNGGEQVLVSGPGANEVVTISSSGTATLQVRVRRTSSYVAQWAGDADTNGDGTRVVTITQR
jgi:photosystem II stability/assembly factor-like uncharacterized protein